MSESKKGFMDEIITVKDALKWFEDKEKVCSGYRGQITESELANKENNKMEEFIANWNDNKNEMNVEGFNIFDVFESDSSFFAWKHYTKHYNHIKGPDGTPYDFDKLYWGVHKNTKTKKFFYVLSAITKDKRKRKSKEFKYACPMQDCLRGDCDFNFNYDKYPRFLEKLFNGAVTKEEIELLIKCHDVHHTLLNFSLMQCMGGINNLKGSQLKLDGEEKKPEQLDRLDKFVTFLKEYFEIVQSDTEERLKKLKAGQRGSNNAEYLRDYLDQFGCVYNYCAKIYFLPTEDYYTGMMKDEKVFNKIAPLLDTKGSDWQKLLESNVALIDALIESGKQPLDSHDRVVEYMCLAVHFWRAKETYFKLMDKVFETIKAQQ